MRTGAILLSLASGVLAIGPAAPPGKAKETMTEDFIWSDPFTPSLSERFTASCTAEKTFKGTEYTLHDLFNPQPQGLLNWGESLKRVFTGRPFPGDWEGKDPHQYHRHVLKMQYSDVPVAVREWIEKEEMTEGEGKGLFAVYPDKTSVSHRINNMVTFKEGEIDREKDAERVVLFAPGALYHVLPLWVAEGSDCAGKLLLHTLRKTTGGREMELTNTLIETLLDISKYTAEPADGAVVSWTTSRKEPDMKSSSRAMEFTVKAEVLAAKPGQEEPVAEKEEEPATENAEEETTEKPGEEAAEKAEEEAAEEKTDERDEL